MRISARDGAGKRVSARERYVGKCKTCLPGVFLTPIGMAIVAWVILRALSEG